MMAAKARLCGDAETAGKILAAPHPGAAKALSRQVRGFDEQRWEQHRTAAGSDVRNVCRLAPGRRDMPPRLRRGAFCGQHRAVSGVRADVVVALGGGITADGEPRPATVARARRAAGLYRSGRAARLVMSGAYGMYDPPPSRAEATAMAEIAVAAGVPPGSVTAETRSRDTIGNIWFTKPLLGGPAGQSVTVVTSDWHAARVRYLARVIWGPGYQVTVEPLADEAGTRPPEEVARWEAGLLAVSRRWFAAVRPGDDAAIAAVLARDHPVYAAHPRTTLAGLAAMINRDPA